MDRFPFRLAGLVVAPYVALWLAIAAGLLAFGVHEVERNRAATLESGRAEAQNLALVMSQHMIQVLEATDRTLMLAKLVFEGGGTIVSLKQLTESMRPLHGTEAERRINLFDANGRFVGSTDDEIKLGAVSIADRSYFASAKAAGDRPLYIGEPTLGRVSKTTIIPVAKPIVNAQGEFDGVVAIALDPQRLVTVFRSLRVGEQSSVGIAHRDGPVLAWASTTSPNDEHAPKSIADIVQADHVVTLAEVHGTELLAFASLSEDELLANHRRYALATIAFTITTLAAITLPIVWVGARAWREQHRRRVLELRYASAYQQARTDPLTGLANRTAFDEARREAHERQKRDGVPFAIAFIDVDHFKRLNDSMGHEVGDAALCTIAHTLTGCVRQSDIVGRLGGDEFAVLMPNVTGATMHRRFDPIKIDLDAVVARNGWEISFSIGVVACETATPRARDAVNFADRVMYDAKGAGRNSIRYAVYRDGSLIHEPPEAEAAVA